MWLFLTVSWVGLQCVIAVFSDNTHLLFMNHRQTELKRITYYVTLYDAEKSSAICEHNTLISHIRAQQVTHLSK